jgi:hypothetical protein
MLFLVVLSNRNFHPIVACLIRVVEYAMQVFFKRVQLTSFLVDFYEAWSIFPASLAFEFSFFWFHVYFGLLLN